MTFRASPYIDFDSGIVTTQPMELSRERPSPRSLDDMIDLFECRVDVWQFGPAVAILKQIEAQQPGSSSVWAHTAYALLAVVFTYFEMIGKSLNPSAASKRPAWQDFNYGFCDVYPAFDIASGDRSDDALQDVAAFRDRVRNGLYHLGYTKRGLFIHNESRDSVPEDFVVDRSGQKPQYLVNPHQMTRTIVAHFPSFVRRLRDRSREFDDLQVRFRRFFEVYHEPAQKPANPTAPADRKASLSVR